MNSKNREVNGHADEKAIMSSIKECVNKINNDWNECIHYDTKGKTPSDIHNALQSIIQINDAIYDQYMNLMEQFKQLKERINNNRQYENAIKPLNDSIKKSRVIQYQKYIERKLIAKECTVDTNGNLGEELSKYNKPEEVEKHINSYREVFLKLLFWPLYKECCDKFSCLSKESSLDFYNCNLDGVVSAFLKEFKKENTREYLDIDLIFNEYSYRKMPIITIIANMIRMRIQSEYAYELVFKDEDIFSLAVLSKKSDKDLVFEDIVAVQNELKNEKSKILQAIKSQSVDDICHKTKHAIWYKHDLYKPFYKDNTKRYKGIGSKLLEIVGQLNDYGKSSKYIAFEIEQDCLKRYGNKDRNGQIEDLKSLFERCGFILNGKLSEEQNRLLEEDLNRTRIDNLKEKNRLLEEVRNLKEKTNEVNKNSKHKHKHKLLLEIVIEELSKYINAHKPNEKSNANNKSDEYEHKIHDEFMKEQKCQNIRIEEQIKIMNLLKQKINKKASIEPYNDDEYYKNTEMLRNLIELSMVQSSAQDLEYNVLKVKNCEIDKCMAENTYMPYMAMLKQALDSDVKNSLDSELKHGDDMIKCIEKIIQCYAEYVPIEIYTTDMLENKNKILEILIKAQHGNYYNVWEIMELQVKIKMFYKKIKLLMECMFKSVIIEQDIALRKPEIQRVAIKPQKNNCNNKIDEGNAKSKIQKCIKFYNKLENQILYDNNNKSTVIINRILMMLSDNTSKKVVSNNLNYLIDQVGLEIQNIVAKHKICGNKGINKEDANKIARIFLYKISIKYINDHQSNNSKENFLSFLNYVALDENSSNDCATKQKANTTIAKKSYKHAATPKIPNTPNTPNTPKIARSPGDVDKSAKVQNGFMQRSSKYTIESISRPVYDGDKPVVHPFINSNNDEPVVHPFINSNGVTVTATEVDKDKGKYPFEKGYNSNASLSSNSIESIKFRIIPNAAGFLIILMLLLGLTANHMFSIDISQIRIVSVLIQLVSMAIIFAFCLWAIRKHFHACAKKQNNKSTIDIVMLILSGLSTIPLMTINMMNKDATTIDDLCMFMAISLIIEITITNIIAEQPSTIFQAILVIGMLATLILQAGYLAYDEACTKIFHMKLDKIIMIIAIIIFVSNILLELMSKSKIDDKDSNNKKVFMKLLHAVMVGIIVATETISRVVVIRKNSNRSDITAN